MIDKNTELKVVKKEAYGTEHWYIVDREAAVFVTSLTGRLAVKASDLSALRALGVNIEVSPTQVSQ